MIWIYKTTNTNRTEPQKVRESDYIHVKCKSDCSETIIITESAIASNDVTELTEQEAQDLLDAWIAEENTPPLSQDIDGNDIIQQQIRLDQFYAN